MLRATGVLIAGGATGALATHSLTDTAEAAQTELTVAGDEAELRGGTIEHVWLDLAVGWSYAVPSGEAPSTVVVEVLAGTESGDLTVLETVQREEVFLEASGEETFRVDLLDAGVLAADALVPDADGETVATEVHVGAAMRLRDERDLVIAADSQTDTATITIETSAYDPDEYGAVAGAGNVTVDVQ